MFEKVIEDIDNCIPILDDFVQIAALFFPTYRICMGDRYILNDSFDSTMHSLDTNRFSTNFPRQVVAFCNTAITIPNGTGGLNTMHLLSMCLPC